MNMIFSDADMVLLRAIADGLNTYLDRPGYWDEKFAKLKASADLVAIERDRVAALLRRDGAEREAEERREIAVAQLENGEFANIEDTVVPPTPEWLDKAGTTVPYTPRGHDGTVRSVKSVRRLLITQPTYLLSHGVIDERQHSACIWYRDRYEAAEMEPAAAVASYGESVRGDPVYGHLPRTEWGAEARADYRWAADFIPVDMVDLFEAVVLHDVPITQVGKLTKRGFRNARAAFLLACERLYEGVAHRLQKIER